jgi:hypothetical protein
MRKGWPAGLKLRRAQASIDAWNVPRLSDLSAIRRTALKAGSNIHCTGMHVLLTTAGP